MRRSLWETSDRLPHVDGLHELALLGPHRLLNVADLTLRQPLLYVMLAIGIIAADSQ